MQQLTSLYEGTAWVTTKRCLKREPIVRKAPLDADPAVNATMHVHHSLRAEGCPRLALGLLEAERKQTGRIGTVVTLNDE